MSDRRGLTRRRFLKGAGGLAVVAVAAGVAIDLSTSGPAGPLVDLPAPVPGRPTRQHAWEATLKLDQFGNAQAPRFPRLLFFDVRGRPGPRYARGLEAALRGLEHAYAWGPEGLLFTAAWSAHYFTRVLDLASPIPPARAYSDFEQPTIDAYDLCIHLAADDQARVVAAARQLTAALAPFLTLRETRTGFVGAGLPAAHQRVGGIPGGEPVSKDTPLYMGFKSALKKNQASEDAVTIPAGEFAQGTTMTVSYMTLSLESWYRGLTAAQRVARMYSPQTTPRDAARFTTDAESNPNLIGQAIDRYGVIGHSQASARARRDGKPIILRRDFDTADGGQAGLHFVSLQRSIEDFVKTRTAMNQASAQLRNPAITQTDNNGINEFMFVLRRANYVVPPRALRAFPLLPNRDALL